jgi:hypothetical protein
LAPTTEGETGLDEDSSEETEERVLFVDAFAFVVVVVVVVAAVAVALDDVRDERRPSESAV